MRLALRRGRYGTPVDMSRAVDYAQKLLAANPGDSEAILLFFAVRDRYTTALRQAGKSVEAAKEGERTLGVLSLLTSRADFTQDIRERLIMLVSMHPAREEDRTRREEELRTLLRNYDGKRRESLLHRIQHLRREMQQRRDMEQRRQRIRESMGYPARQSQVPTRSRGANAEPSQPRVTNPL